MPLTFQKRNGKTVVFGGEPKPVDGPRRYRLGDQLVTISEASTHLGVGLATIMRHTHADVIDVATIRTLAPIVPATVLQAKAIPSRNGRIIRRIASSFHGAQA